MLQHQDILEIKTTGRGLHEITAEVKRVVSASGIHTGLCIVFCCHTSASLVIQENADPTAKADLLTWLSKIAPDNEYIYSHDSEGKDDMPAHLRAAVTRTSETVPIADGRLTLGIWQGLYLAEHRIRPHTRKVVIHVQGTRS